jgi:hypothetical protein
MYSFKEKDMMIWMMIWMILEFERLVKLIELKINEFFVNLVSSLFI